ncbi:hypothetical protein D3OALGB2SA_3193 [Olavius algarvensis associated proteobacterium Delta 3]|nr:hypothetical protein D3OALGB2SA_3193 [Olavius algarvensis associated proteobacterium Delta 3]
MVGRHTGQGCKVIETEVLNIIIAIAYHGTSPEP